VGEEGQRKVAVVILLQQVVVPNYPHAISRARIASGRDGRGDATLRLLSKRLRIVAQVTVIFTEDARCMPQLTDRDAFGQLRKSLAVVKVGMRQYEARQIWLAVPPRQLGHELINDGNSLVVARVGDRPVIEINLHDHGITDHDGCCRRNRQAKK
jgi:hypothetical protein